MIESDRIGIDNEQSTASHGMFHHRFEARTTLRHPIIVLLEKHAFSALVDHGMISIRLG